MNISPASSLSAWLCMVNFKALYISSASLYFVWAVEKSLVSSACNSYASFPFTGVATESLLIQDLTIGATYQVGVNVVDKSGFKKMSAYDGSGEDLYTDSSSVNAGCAFN